MEISLERATSRSGPSVYRQIADHIRLEVEDGRLELDGRVLQLLTQPASLSPAEPGKDPEA